MQADGAPPVGCRSAGGSFERAMPSDYSGDEESNYEPSPTPGDRDNRKEKTLTNMPYDEALELSQVSCPRGRARGAAPGNENPRA